jgi:xanthine dehydrogenase, molybdenum binding subunit apoprotein (EC 1.17.1.4)
MGASDFSKLPHIGESLRRKEDYRFLTGAGQYTDDVVLAAQSHAVFVRSPHAHAKSTASTSMPPRLRPASWVCSPVPMWRPTTSTACPAAGSSPAPMASP